MSLFGHTLSLVVDFPMVLSLRLTDAMGLSTHQACLVALLSFVIATPPFFWLVSTRIDTVSVYLILMVTAVWLALGMGVECRSELGDSSTAIVDVGHDLLAPLNRYLNSDAGDSFHRMFVTVDSLYVFAVFGVMVYLAIVRKQPAVLLKGIAGGCIRMVIGALTRLPAPRGYHPAEGDWPPQTSACPGFIFTPSGHVLQSVMLALTLRRTQGARRSLAVCFANTIDVCNVAQSLLLITTRGHYTVDIITAVLLAIVVDDKVERFLTRRAALQLVEDRTKARSNVKEHVR